MKTIQAITLAGVLALAAFDASAQNPQNAQVCLRHGSAPGNYLRMRAYPAERAPTVERAYHAEDIVLVSRRGSFYLIEDSLGTRGWVPARYICRY